MCDLIHFDVYVCHETDNGILKMKYLIFPPII